MHPAINPALNNKVINKSREEIKSSGLRCYFLELWLLINLSSCITFPFLFIQAEEHPRETYNEVTYDSGLTAIFRAIKNFF